MDGYDWEWVGMGGPNWSQMAPKPKCLPMASYGPKWPQMAPNGPKWPQMVTNDPKWSQMVPNLSVFNLPVSC